MVYRACECSVANDLNFLEAHTDFLTFLHFLLYSLQAMEQEMEEAMGGLQWPANGAPSGDENPECKQS